MECPECHKEFKPKTANHRFCSEACQRAAYRKLQEPRKCEKCGSEFIIARVSTESMCPKCRIEEAQKKALAAQRKAIIAQKVAKAEKKPTKTLADWSREAAECNLDYGTYRGLVEHFGKTYEEIRAQYADRTTAAHAHAGKSSRHAGDVTWGQKVG